MSVYINSARNEHDDVKLDFVISTDVPKEGTNETDSCQKTVLRKGMVKNNLTALGIHFLVVVGTFMGLMVFYALLGDVYTYNAAGELVPTVVYLLNPLMWSPLAYILLAYFFLKPLPRKNLWSISGLAVFFLVGLLAGLAYSELMLRNVIAWTGNPDAVLGAVFFAFNHAAFYTVMYLQTYLIEPVLVWMGLIPAGIPLADVFWDSELFRAVSLGIMAILPTLFMYLGLRLKIWKHKRSESNVE